MATAVAYPSYQSKELKPVASIRDVTHHYGKVLALDHISLEIPTGIMVGIVGPDGAGKSTLLALMAGSKKVQEGRVAALEGGMRKVRHRRAVCARVGYMPRGLGKHRCLELTGHESVDGVAQRFGLSPSERPSK